MTRPLVFVDCETTGLDPDRHEIWEIAYAVGDDPIVSSFVSHQRITLDHETVAAMRRNHYLDRCLPLFTTLSRLPQMHNADADRDHISGPFERALVDLLDGATLVGASPAFDANMLCARWGFAPWHYRLFDVESFAAGVLNLDHVPSLSEICERLDIAPGDHTAAGDVRAVREAHQTLRTLRGGLGPLL